MTQKDRKTEKSLYSLVPLEKFKALMGLDDREDKTSRFCLITSTFSIEQYCKRKFLRKKHTDFHKNHEGHIFTLREYPLRVIHSVNIKMEYNTGFHDFALGPDGCVGPENYYTLPDAGICEDMPFSLILRPPLSKSRIKMLFKISYTAGYSVKKVLADLASACLELAMWNMNRYRGRLIGISGNTRGNSRNEEHFEMSMPKNVRSLLEPYRRKVI